VLCSVAISLEAPEAWVAVSRKISCRKLSSLATAELYVVAVVPTPLTCRGSLAVIKLLPRRSRSVAAACSSAAATLPRRMPSHARISAVSVVPTVQSNINPIKTGKVKGERSRLSERLMGEHLFMQ
jgi:hypothetical protein